MTIWLLVGWVSHLKSVSQPVKLFYIKIQIFVELLRQMNFSDFVPKECWSWSNRSTKTCSRWWNRLDCLVYICYLFPIQCLCNTRNELYHIIYIKAEILNRFIDEIATRKVSSMLVDDVTWWQLWDVGDSFGHFGHQHPLSFRHQHWKDVTNILIPSSTSKNSHQR